MPPIKSPPLSVPPAAPAPCSGTGGVGTVGVMETPPAGAHLGSLAHCRPSLKLPIMRSAQEQATFALCRHSQHPRLVPFVRLPFPPQQPLSFGPSGSVPSGTVAGPPQVPEEPHKPVNVIRPTVPSPSRGSFPQGGHGGAPAVCSASLYGHPLLRSSGNPYLSSMVSPGGTVRTCEPGLASPSSGRTLLRVAWLCPLALGFLRHPCTPLPSRANLTATGPVHCPWQKDEEPEAQRQGPSARGALQAQPE